MSLKHKAAIIPSLTTKETLDLLAYGLFEDLTPSAQISLWEKFVPLVQKVSDENKRRQRASAEIDDITAALDDLIDKVDDARNAVSESIAILEEGT